MEHLEDMVENEMNRIIGAILSITSEQSSTEDQESKKDHNLSESDGPDSPMSLNATKLLIMEAEDNSMLSSQRVEKKFKEVTTGV